MPLYKSLKKHKLLLDTHVWIWLMLGDERLSPSFRREIGHSKKLIPLTSRMTIESPRLPENPQGDPAARILISSAHEYNAVLVTHDQKILDYGKRESVSVYDPCSS